MKVPCKNCLIIPICRHKLFRDLFMECDQLRKLIPTYDILGKARVTGITEVFRAICPSTWHIIARGSDTLINRYVENMYSGKTELLYNGESYKKVE